MIYKEILRGLIKDLEEDINCGATDTEKISSITNSTERWKKEYEYERSFRKWEIKDGQ